jgi:hypothetical protein
MKRLGMGAVSAVVLWVALMLAQVAGGMLFMRGVPAFTHDGPLDSGQAAAVVAAVDAVLLTLLAGGMRARGPALGLQLGALLFGVQTLQALIEAVAFNNDLHIASAILLATAAAALLRAALAAGAIALLWRGRAEAGLALQGLAWKAPVIAAVYVACYFTAGAQIAWRSPEVRAFYAHVGQIDAGFLISLQFARGLLWCALAWLLARGMPGPSWRTALMTGLAFSCFMIPELLFPNPAMPWPVRSVHMVEVGVSNFLFGAAAALILLSRIRAGAAAHVSAP